MIIAESFYLTDSAALSLRSSGESGKVVSDLINRCLPARSQQVSLDNCVNLKQVYVQVMLI